jgi:serine/threonine protein kinase
MLRRFAREAQVCANLHHPNICAIYDVGAIDGTHYLAMAYIDGRPLSAHIPKGKGLPVEEALRLGRVIALAVVEAHNKGVIHRDLKPANVMMGPGGQPVVMDFGLARRESDTSLTATGMAMGTPAYMPPEQAAGRRADIGPRSDVYSLGVILFEMLTGRRPFEGSMARVLGGVMNDPPPKPSSLRQGLPSHLDAVILKALAKKPQDRFDSMADFAAALDRPGAGKGRLVLWAALGAALAAVLIGGLIYLML